MTRCDGVEERQAGYEAAAREGSRLGSPPAPGTERQKEDVLLSKLQSPSCVTRDSGWAGGGLLGGAGPAMERQASLEMLGTEREEYSAALLLPLQAPTRASRD